jgi:hypothetical protein
VGAKGNKRLFAGGLKGFWVRGELTMWNFLPDGPNLTKNKKPLYEPQWLFVRGIIYC